MKQITQFLLVFLFFIEQTISAEVRVMYDHASPTNGIQEAINKASSDGGGMVFVPKGSVSDNMMTDCNTGIDCSESLYCFFTGNTLRNCQTAFHFHSTDENFPTMKNVSCNNMLVHCEVEELIGKGVKEHTSVNNHIIK